MNRRIIAVVQTLTIILSSAFVGVLVKLALRDVPPFTFVWLQIASGGSLLTLYTFGVLALASTNNIARKLALVTGDGLSNNILSTVALWIGGLPVVLTGLMIDWPPPVVGWKNCGIILLNAIVTIAIGLTVLNYVLRTLRSYEVSILAGSGVIWTAICAVPILGERLALHQIVGIAMMLMGFSLVQVRRGILK